MSSLLQENLKECRQKGQYANYLEVGHNACEFILDFGQFHKGDDDPKFVARVITNPSYLKSFLKVLLQSIEEYEKSHGHIRQQEQPDYFV